MKYLDAKSRPLIPEFTRPCCPTGLDIGCPCEQVQQLFWVKTLLLIPLLAAMLCGCSHQNDSRIAALEQRMAWLEAQTNHQPVIVTNSLDAAQIAQLKMWTL